MKIATFGFRLQTAENPETVRSLIDYAHKKRINAIRSGRSHDGWDSMYECAVMTYKLMKGWQ